MSSQLFANNSRPSATSFSEIGEDWHVVAGRVPVGRLQVWRWYLSPEDEARLGAALEAGTHTTTCERLHGGPMRLLAQRNRVRPRAPRKFSL